MSKKHLACNIKINIRLTGLPSSFKRIKEIRILKQHIARNNLILKTQMTWNFMIDFNLIYLLSSMLKADSNTIRSMYTISND
jgi:hypothetical protein